MTTYMHVCQRRDGDKIIFRASDGPAVGIDIAWLFDGQDDFVFDDHGDILTLKIAGILPPDYRVVMPLTPAEARKLDASA